MTTHVALLRGINVGGNRKVSMADLKGFLGELGFENPRTLLQSGNAVFGSSTRSGAALEGFLESQAAKRLGLETLFLVRTAAEWAEIIARNPFPAEAKSDPSHMVVMALKEAPASKAVAALQAAIKGREVVRAIHRELYAICPDGIGDSRLTVSLIDRTLGVQGTARNWNTVLKLAAMTG